MPKPRNVVRVKHVKFVSAILILVIVAPVLPRVRAAGDPLSKIEEVALGLGVDMGEPGNVYRYLAAGRPVVVKAGALGVVGLRPFQLVLAAYLAGRGWTPLPLRIFDGVFDLSYLEEGDADYIVPRVIGNASRVVFRLPDDIPVIAPDYRDVFPRGTSVYMVNVTVAIGDRLLTFPLYIGVTRNYAPAAYLDIYRRRLVNTEFDSYGLDGVVRLLRAGEKSGLVGGIESLVKRYSDTPITSVTLSRRLKVAYVDTGGGGSPWPDVYEFVPPPPSWRANLTDNDLFEVSLEVRPVPSDIHYQVESDYTVFMVLARKISGSGVAELEVDTLYIYGDTEYSGWSSTYTLYPDAENRFKVTVYPFDADAVGLRLALHGPGEWSVEVIKALNTYWLSNGQSDLNQLLSSELRKDLKLYVFGSTVYNIKTIVDGGSASSDVRSGYLTLPTSMSIIRDPSETSTLHFSVDVWVDTPTRSQTYSVEAEVHVKIGDVAWASPSFTIGECVSHAKRLSADIYVNDLMDVLRYYASLSKIPLYIWVSTNTQMPEQLTFHINLVSGQNSVMLPARDLIGSKPGQMPGLHNYQATSLYMDDRVPQSYHYSTALANWYMSKAKAASSTPIALAKPVTVETWVLQRDVYGETASSWRIVVDIHDPSYADLCHVDYVEVYLHYPGIQGGFIGAYYYNISMAPNLPDLSRYGSLLYWAGLGLEILASMLGYSPATVLGHVLTGNSVIVESYDQLRNSVSGQVEKDVGPDYAHLIWSPPILSSSTGAAGLEVVVDSELSPHYAVATVSTEVSLHDPSGSFAVIDEEVEARLGVLP